MCMKEASAVGCAERLLKLTALMDTFACCTRCCLCSVPSEGDPARASGVTAHLVITNPSDDAVMFKVGGILVQKPTAPFLFPDLGSTPTSTACVKICRAPDTATLDACCTGQNHGTTEILREAQFWRTVGKVKCHSERLVAQVAKCVPVLGVLAQTCASTPRARSRCRRASCWLLTYCVLLCAVVLQAAAFPSATEQCKDKFLVQTVLRADTECEWDKDTVVRGHGG